MFNLHTSHASETLVVPQDYSTIGEAISHASAGDTILIQSGIYNENIRIDKSLMMEGQDQSNTIIFGKGRFHSNFSSDIGCKRGESLRSND